MRKELLTLATMLILLASGPVCAHESVVVVPLGKTSNGQATSNLWPVYDSSDVFVGYYLERDSANNRDWIISSKGYVTFAGSYYLLIPSQYYRIYYSESNCSGSGEHYYASHDALLWGPTGVAGIGWGGNEYISKDATLETFQVQSYLNDTLSVCKNLLSPEAVEAYQPLPNDPAVTGFQNSYNFPLKAVISVPPAP